MPPAACVSAPLERTFTLRSDAMVSDGISYAAWYCTDTSRRFVVPALLRFTMAPAPARTLVRLKSRTLAALPPMVTVPRLLA